MEIGLLGPKDVQNRINEVSARSPANGARVVAKAWVNPAYKQRLLDEPRSAIAERGHSFPEDTDLVVLENTESVHHIIVCTLCS